jgi:phenylpyruvate tautomerase
MPYLKITISQSVDMKARQRLLTTASKAVAAELGKPEEYMMVSLEGAVPMLFGGTEEPCAFLELRAIGLPKAKTAKLSQLLCGMVETELGVRRNRVYVNFADVPANLWGWNGGTF